jgi:hypothetical protein
MERVAGARCHFRKPRYTLRLAGGVPEWLKGADCKSVGLRLRWFESSLLHHGGLAEVGAKIFGRIKAVVPAPSSSSAGVAQLVELLPSKQNVASSSLVSRSRLASLVDCRVRWIRRGRRSRQWFAQHARKPVLIAHVAQW